MPSQMRILYRRNRRENITLPIFDLFSERNKPKVPDVFTYDEFSDRLRGQLRHIIVEINELTGGSQNSPSELVAWFHKALTKEMGLFQLSRSTRSVLDDIDEFIMLEKNVEFIIDLFQLAFSFDPEWLLVSLYGREARNRLEQMENIIAETNERFMRAGVGYQYKDGQFYRIDSTHVHQEIILPALSILADEEYQGANEEYRKAHEHYRKQDYATCLVECCKAFESVMKSICDQNKWTYDKHSDTASRLVLKLESNGLFPTYLTNSLNHLIGMLSSAVPTVRNKQGGHGQGAQPVPVVEEYAAFCLQSTAANIILLAKLAK